MHPDVLWETHFSHSFHHCSVLGPRWRGLFSLAVYWSLKMGVLPGVSIPPPLSLGMRAEPRGFFWGPHIDTCLIPGNWGRWSLRRGPFPHATFSRLSFGSDAAYSAQMRSWDFSVR